MVKPDGPAEEERRFILDSWIDMQKYGSERVNNRADADAGTHWWAWSTTKRDLPFRAKSAAFCEFPSSL